MLLLRGVELESAVVKGDEGERRDWEDKGVRGMGVEEGKVMGRGEVPALVELEMESVRLSWSKKLRFESELRRLEVVEPNLLGAVTEGFSPRSHISAWREEREK